MKILVISGYQLNKNSSANLSHNAFIEGFLRLGFEVDMLCHSFVSNGESDEIPVPKINNLYMYDGLSLYEKLSPQQSDVSEHHKLVKSSTEDKDVEKKSAFKARIAHFLKGKARALYGIYNPSVAWYYRAKWFSSDTQYDYVVSMGYPHISHRVAAYLIKHHRIITKKWVQLWEDPWFYSLELHGREPKVKKAEYKLLNDGWDIVYVSPITLKNQQRIFERDKDKMRWCPLAAYYHSYEVNYTTDKNHYGYFGDYSPYARNLRPFYDVAVGMGLHVDICGSPSDLFPPQGNVHIYPRLPLGELKKHEDKANVAICLFNLGGGQIPGKIYQLAATNKTILAILDGPEDEQKIIRDYFEKFNRFVFCQNNEHSITEAIERIENHDLGGVSNQPIDAFSVDKVAKILLGD